jgi:hypothetical protein
MPVDDAFPVSQADTDAGKFMGTVQALENTKQSVGAGWPAPVSANSIERFRFKPAASPWKRSTRKKHSTMWLPRSVSPSCATA